jgi:4-hydroxy-4-methyl-2-oxoglutarate aldolase
MSLNKTNTNFGALLKLNTNLLADAMNRNGAMDYLIKPLSNNTQVIGRAYTVDLRPGDNLYLHHALYTANAGDVLVINGKSNVDNAYLGELMVMAAHERNLGGIVLDGLVRDRDFIEQVDFPVFAKGFVPNGPYKDGPGKVNSVISCGGVTVYPGDIIYGDRDGVVVIPQNQLQETVNKANEKLLYEEKRIEELKEIRKRKDSGEADIEVPPPSWLANKIK